MHQLVMPLALAGLQIHRQDRFAEQFVARPMAAVKIAGGQFHGNVSHSQLLIHADLAPDAGISGIGRGIFFPGVVAEFVRPRNGVKYP